MIGSINTRPATAADLIAIERIAAASPTAPQWTRTQFQEALSNPTSNAILRTILCADTDGHTIGFAVISALVSIYPVEAELESIAVDPDHRGHGAGQALLRAALQWVTTLQPGSEAIHFRLEVRISNTPALRLYERNDFKATAIRPAYYTNPSEDAVCMERTIP